MIYRNQNLWDSAYELYKQFQKLRNIFKEEGHEPLTSCEFDFTKEGLN